LVSVTIPDSVETVGADAFSHCDSLNTVFYQGSKTISSDAFRFVSFRLRNVCVSPDYNSSKLGNVDVSSNSKMCSSFQSVFNHCFKGLFVNGSFITEKRVNVSEWEKRSNNCAKYVCDNSSGPISWSLCNSSDDMDLVCVDEQCVEQNDAMNGREWSVEIIMNGTKVDDVYTVEVISTVNELTSIKLSGDSIGVVVDETGFVVRIVIYVEDEETANTIASAIEGIEKGRRCVYGTLCRTKSIHVIDHRNLSSDVLLSDGSRYSMNIMLLLLSLCVMRIF